MSNEPGLRAPDPVAPGRVAGASVLPVRTGVGDRTARCGSARQASGTGCPCGVSKHAVTALTETLYFNLRSRWSARGEEIVASGPPARPVSFA